MASRRKKEFEEVVVGGQGSKRISNSTESWMLCELCKSNLSLNEQLNCYLMNEISIGLIRQDDSLVADYFYYSENSKTFGVKQWKSRRNDSCVGNNFLFQNYYF